MGENFFKEKKKRILLLQLVSISIFATSFVLKIFEKLFLNIIPIALAFFNAYLIYNEKERAVTYLFGGLSALGVLLAFLPPEMNLTVSYFVVLIVFFVVFRLFFMEKEVEGEVLASSDEWAVFKTGFDLSSGVKGGVYAVKNDKGVEKGEKAIASVKKKFGERRRPWRIREKT